MVSLDVCCCRRRGRGGRRRNNHRRNPQKSHLKKNRTKNQPTSFRDFLLFPLSIFLILLSSAEKPMKLRKPPTSQTKTAHGNSGSNPFIPIIPPSNIPLFRRNQRHHHPRTKIDRISGLHTHKSTQSENCAAVEDSCEEVEDEEEEVEMGGGEGLS